ncbi:hypothetical protein FA95DRAFT_1481195 [Auriscalpium vulgare]|uniref:Uncharacterized protein n=1 Tax=Auriscalpium vulgare TaxID=40419 RepID=A0ACB8SAM0_9AGAM|nr:hypothetical protein FA95DRAFT_1481195 [Auriscalpium vulgare]
MEEPLWRQLKLALEPLYKDDDGRPIPAVADILQDGGYVYEPNHGPGAHLEENIRRILHERGADFFEQDEEERRQRVPAHESKDDVDVADAEDVGEPSAAKPMTQDELFKMRTDIMPQLNIALGEMNLAKDVLSLFISSTAHEPSAPSSQAIVTSSSSALPPNVLTASSVSKTQPIPSVQAFDAQLIAGGKDEALRKASALFKAAAESAERGRQLGDRYWTDALKIRRRNWALIPSPLPRGAPTGRGADRTAKDFLVSFGLTESSAVFRRRALAHLATFGAESEPITFPQRQKTILCVSLKTTDSSGVVALASNRLTSDAEDAEPLNSLLKASQREVIEQEIFASLIHDAGNMATTSARVSERLVVVEAAAGVNVMFELVDSGSVAPQPPGSKPALQAKCDLIYHLLHVLLLRVHAYTKSKRLGDEASTHTDGQQAAPQSRAILHPVIDLLQYEVFCDRIKSEMQKIVAALRQAGVATIFRFDTVGENGSDIVKLLSSGGLERIGGDAVIRIDNSRTLRFTFYAPSLLTAHLSQATLPISSVPQLIQLLYDETEQCLLQGICDVGAGLSETRNGTWFVDLLMGRSVGKWEGCVVCVTSGASFCIIHGHDPTGPSGFPTTKAQPFDASHLDCTDRTDRRRA